MHMVMAGHQHLASSFGGLYTGAYHSLSVYTQLFTFVVTNKELKYFRLASQLKHVVNSNMGIDILQMDLWFGLYPLLNQILFFILAIYHPLFCLFICLFFCTYFDSNLFHILEVTRLNRKWFGEEGQRERKLFRRNWNIKNFYECITTRNTSSTLLFLFVHAVYYLVVWSCSLFLGPFHGCWTLF